jgi:hypothetical protein
MIVSHKNIPTFDYKTKKWTYTSFESQEVFSLFLKELFKEPGFYEFDESTKVWRSEADRYEEYGYYTKALKGTQEYLDYWNTQKERCRKGVIYKNGDKTWYVTREYYMLLNFLPIINKEKGNIESFCDIRDVQYHLALYEKRAECENKHGVVTKKRQMLSSFYHTAKMINVYWFERKAILRNLAGDESYLTGEKGIWNYYNGYRDFLNVSTGWIRENNPNKDLSWIQRREIVINGVKSYSGRKSVMTGTTFKKSPTAGVGGPSYYNYFEEAGTFNKLDKTYIYMKPALEAGPGVTTGFFIAAGSVGELKDCKPLKKFMEYPEENGFLGVVNNWVDKDRIPKVTGLFIPEQWGMIPFVDEWGNSKVEEALNYLNEEFDKLEKEMDAADYQLYISQHPRYMSEAFAYREVSKFPIKRIEKRQQEIKDRGIGGKPVELYEDEYGNVKWRHSDKKDVGYPVNPKNDNSGVVMMIEPPKENIKVGDYFGGVDNIEVGITITSDSLFAIYIVKPSTEVTIYEDGKLKGKRVEAPKIVCHYTGRIDAEDPEPTNEIGRMIIKLYKAFTLCERNKPNFITHMRKKGMTNLLATERDVPIYKEINFGSEYTGSVDIGIYMDATGKKQNICDSYLIQYLNDGYEVISKKDKDGNETGDVYKTYHGIDYIDDYWLLEELKHPADNTDRRDAARLAFTLMKIWESNNIMSRRVEHIGEKPKPREYKPRVIDLMGSIRPHNTKKQRTIIL